MAELGEGHGVIDVQFGCHFARLPTDLRIAFVQHWLDVCDILALRSTCKKVLAEQDTAFSNGKLKSRGFDRYIYRSLDAANWVIKKKIQLRMFTLELPQLEDYTPFSPPRGVRRKHMTTLFYICSNNHVDIAKLMLSKGTQNSRELSSKDGKPWEYRLSPPFYAACELGHVEIVKAFMGCKHTWYGFVSSGGFTSLHVAANEGRTKVVRALLAVGHFLHCIDDVTNGNHTALHLAVCGGYAAIVGLLLEFGASPVVPVTSRADTVLHTAAQHGNPETLRLLLADSRITNSEACTGVSRAAGFNPLHMAVDNGRLEAVRLLLEHIPASSTTSDGFTSVDIARIRERGKPRFSTFGGSDREFHGRMRQALQREAAVDAAALGQDENSDSTNANNATATATSSANVRDIDGITNKPSGGDGPPGPMQQLLLEHVQLANTMQPAAQPPPP